MICRARVNASNISFADPLMIAQDSQNIEYDNFKIIDKNVARIYVKTENKGKNC